MNKEINNIFKEEEIKIIKSKNKILEAEIRIIQTKYDILKNNNKSNILNRKVFEPNNHILSSIASSPCGYSKYIF